VIAHTDSNTALNGLSKQKLQGAAFYPMRHIWLLAAQHDIELVPRRIAGVDNSIADALSRFNWKTLANLCPHWQFPYKTTSCPLGSELLLPPCLTNGPNSSSLASQGRLKRHTTQLSLSTKHMSKANGQGKRHGRRQKPSFARGQHTS
jgi:hypothetical protein